MQPLTDYHKRIIQYYNTTENAYKDAWDLDNSLSIHYGYRDKQAKTFSQSLLRMNEKMMEEATVKPGEKILDAGCGIGGSSIYLAERMDCDVIGISLSARQIEKANELIKEKGLTGKIRFDVQDYCNTTFEDQSFDVVWCCESICYAADKEKFIREAMRLLKPGGRLVIADGFVTEFENNDHPFIKKWLQGWQVNYLETPERFVHFMKQNGFGDLVYKDISRNVMHSAKRLNRFYYLANLYIFWKAISFSKRATKMQKLNIWACRYQYLGLRKRLWQYGLAVGRKPF